MNFYEILETFRSNSLSEAEKGNKFERMIRTGL